MDMVTARGIATRMLRAARLDPAVFRDASFSPTANRDLLIALGAAALAAGIGTLIGMLSTPFVDAWRAVVIGLVVRPIVIAASWAVFAGLAWLLATRGNPSTTFMAVGRPLALAHAPLALLILTFIPVVGPVVQFLAIAWLLLAAFVALREVLTLNESQALLVSLSGYTAGLLVMVLAGSQITFGVLGGGLSGAIFAAIPTL
jgi:hypothetical protein